MVLKWTASAQRDLVRLHSFLELINPRAAVQVVHQLVAGAEQLLIYQQLGVPLLEFASRDVRRIIIGDYELRYELTQTTTYILRIWHVREDRY